MLHFFQQEICPGPSLFNKLLTQEWLFPLTDELILSHALKPLQMNILVLSIIEATFIFLQMIHLSLFHSHWHEYLWNIYKPDFWKQVFCTECK